MEHSKHRVLLVEDDANTRDDLAEILRSVGCDVVSCDNRQTALQHVAEQAFCMAVLDLQIFGEPGATKPYEDNGRSLLREVRKIYPHHSGSAFTFPILVVSGYAEEWETAKGVTQDGANDIIRKPPKSGEVSSLVRVHFQRSGRESHDQCVNAQGASVARKSDLELSIPGERRKRQTQVRLGAQSVSLSDRHLRVLLHLVKGRLTGKLVHNSDMGFKGTGGNRLPSELNERMRAAFPPGVDTIVTNDYHGSYGLIDGVTIGEITGSRLVALNDERITRLAGEIEMLRSRSGGNG